MKKIFLTAIMLVSVAISASAQIEIMGTYKYGSKNERIHIKAIQRPSGDQVVLLEFAPLTRLESEVKELRKKEENLRKDLKKCQDKRPADNSEELKSLQDSLASVRSQIADKDRQLNDLNAEMEQLRSDVAACRKEKADTIAVLLAKINRLTVKKVEPALNSDALSVSAGMNMSRLINDGIGSEPWMVGLSVGKEAELTWLHYFSQSSPVAIRVGVAYRELNGRAGCDMIRDTLFNQVDMDYDSYNAHYSFSEISEQMQLRQISIPLLLHIGNTYKNFGLKGWFEAGVSMSFNIATTLERRGTYSCEGWYPEWNVTLRDVPQLGFVSGANLTVPETAELASFMLWGRLAAGVYIPVSDKLGMELGASCDYSLMPVSDGNGIGTRRYNENALMITDGGKTRILTAAVKLGLVYHL